LHCRRNRSPGTNGSQPFKPKVGTRLLGARLADLRRSAHDRRFGGERMYLGPLRWPSMRIWLSALGVVVVIALLALLGLDATVVTIVMAVVVFAIAAPRRARDLGADRMRDSRPEN
jgi:hypothetical protein